MGSCWGLVLGYWPEEEPDPRPQEAAQAAGFVPVKVWARTEAVTLSPKGVGQGRPPALGATRGEFLQIRPHRNGGR